jgi:acyl phosphate:glycerol-3-phosphate acyltransferase
MLQSFTPSLLPAYAAALAFGYLCGSVPFGLIITRLAGTRDIRSIGSGNIGATNVLRTGRKGLAAATLVGDALKGTFAVLAIYYYYGPEYRYFAHDLAIPAAFGAFLGHLFPVWLGFKGGKGVATSGGILIAYAWPVGLVAFATWLGLAFLTRYSSLAALVAALLSPLYAWLLIGDPQTTQVVALLAVLVVLRHHANIRRLLKGEESKIRLSKS